MLRHFATAASSLGSSSTWAKPRGMGGNSGLPCGLGAAYLHDKTMPKVANLCSSSTEETFGDIPPTKSRTIVNLAEPAAGLRNLRLVRNTNANLSTASDRPRIPLTHCLCSSSKSTNAWQWRDGAHAYGLSSSAPGNVSSITRPAIVQCNQYSVESCGHHTSLHKSRPCHLGYSG